MRGRVLPGIACVLLAAAIARAGYMPMPMPISQAMGQADAIVIVSVTAYSLDAPPPPATLPHILMGAGEMPALMAFRQAGVYDLKLIQTLHGVCDSNFEIGLPLLSSFYYDGNRFDVPPGSRVLLLLKKDEQQRWTVVDPLLPLIPLPQPAKAAAAGAVATNAAPKNPDALDVLLGALPDDALRPVLAHILREMQDQRACATMRAYADDDNRRVRSDALYCMAVNQDVAAIPKIAKLEQELEKNQTGHSPVGGLALYKTPAAVPYLNPLVADGTDFTRLNALSALAALADQSSIPFLIKALDNDDRQQLVAYFAYTTLHRLAPSLGPAKTRDDFLAHKDGEIQTVKQWWQQEQTKAANTPASPSTSAPKP